MCVWERDYRGEITGRGKDRWWGVGSERNRHWQQGAIVKRERQHGVEEGETEDRERERKEEEGQER